MTWEGGGQVGGLGACFLWGGGGCALGDERLLGGWVDFEISSRLADFGPLWEGQRLEGVHRQPVTNTIVTGGFDVCL
jgi:hypothetical protein